MFINMSRMLDNTIIFLKYFHDLWVIVFFSKTLNCVHDLAFSCRCKVFSIIKLCGVDVSFWGSSDSYFRIGNA
jgi:hypothetical protein